MFILLMDVNKDLNECVKGIVGKDIIIYKYFVMIFEMEYMYI